MTPPDAAAQVAAIQARHEYAARMNTVVGTRSAEQAHAVACAALAVGVWRW